MTMITEKQNFGNQVTLLGALPNQTWKLIRVRDEQVMAQPWLITCSGSVVYPVSAAVGPVARGIFGSGGVTHYVEFDVKPDSLIALPGTSVDLDVGWDAALVATSNGAAPATIVKSTNFAPFGDVLPTSAKIVASAKHGLPSVPNSTRSFFLYVNAAVSTVINLDVPPFANELNIYAGAAANYAANIANLRLVSSNVSSAEYSGAELAAFFTSGTPIPLYGGVDKIQLNTLGPGANSFRLSYNLNL